MSSKVWIFPIYFYALNLIKNIQIQLTVKTCQTKTANNKKIKNKIALNIYIKSEQESLKEL
jgi:hypothetical protein